MRPRHTNTRTQRKCNDVDTLGTLSIFQERTCTTYCDDVDTIVTLPIFLGAIPTAHRPPSSHMFFPRPTFTVLCNCGPGQVAACMHVALHIEHVCNFPAPKKEWGSGERHAFTRQGLTRRVESEGNEAAGWEDTGVVDFYYLSPDGKDIRSWPKVMKELGSLPE